MKKTATNYAFVDGQNINLGTRQFGWTMDFAKFRVYLAEKFDVSRAYYFIGYMEENKPLYAFLKSVGYRLIFKPILVTRDGTVKGNCDADLVLRTMIDLHKYTQAVIVSGDGDFYSLVDYLFTQGKLKNVLVPHPRTCSALLTRYAHNRIVFLDNVRHRLQRASLPADGKTKKEPKRLAARTEKKMKRSQKRHGKKSVRDGTQPTASPRDTAHSVSKKRGKSTRHASSERSRSGRHRHLKKTVK